MTDAPGMIEGMGKNTYTPQSVAHVQNEGNVLQTIGMVVAAIGVIGGIVVGIAGGSAVLFALIPIGLLCAITGYLKQIATATAATYTLAANQAVTSSEELDAPQA